MCGKSEKLFPWALCGGLPVEGGDKVLWLLRVFRYLVGPVHPVLPGCTWCCGSASSVVDGDPVCGDCAREVKHG